MCSLFPKGERPRTTFCQSTCFKTTIVQSRFCFYRSKVNDSLLLIFSWEHTVRRKRPSNVISFIFLLSENICGIKFRCDDPEKYSDTSKNLIAEVWPFKNAVTDPRILLEPDETSLSIYMKRIHAPPRGLSISIQVYLVGEIHKVCKEMEAKKQDFKSVH